MKNDAPRDKVRLDNECILGQFTYLKLEVMDDDVHTSDEAKNLSLDSSEKKKIKMQQDSEVESWLIKYFKENFEIFESY